MTLHELGSTESVNSFRRSHPNSLICFSATWCGPCQRSKTTLMDLAASYDRDPTLNVKVGIVYEHMLGDSIHLEFGVRAFPTYVLYTNHGMKEAGRIEGVNFDGIRKMIEMAGCKRDLGTGYSLGSTAESGGIHSSPVSLLSTEETRARRLAMLEQKINHVDSPSQPEPVPMALDVVADETMMVEKNTDETQHTKNEAPSSATVDITENWSQEDLVILTDSMGFSLIRAQKGLLHGGGSVDGAVEWIMLHQDDADIDEPIKMEVETSQNKEEATGAVAQSYKCNECGKILSNMANLELHANKTGHSDFEESTQSVKPLTAEEKAAKVAEIKALVKARRTERESKEKEENIEQEKQRRFMGKEMAKTREQMEMDARNREAYLRKKEKEAFKAERERIRRELEQDKLERIAHKGKLASKLGIDGYRPDAIQYDAPSAAHEATSDGSAGHKEVTTPMQGEPGMKPKTKNVNTAKIDEYISKVSSYKAGGDGGNCLKVLLAYIKNVIDNPTEEKYRSINMENKAFKTKVKPFIGAKSLLLAIGFNQEQEMLVMTELPNVDLLQSTKLKLESALIAYGC